MVFCSLLFLFMCFCWYILCSCLYVYIRLSLMKDGYSVIYSIGATLWFYVHYYSDSYVSKYLYFFIQYSMRGSPDST
ncbi:hypothetical protein BDW42DRAFT_52668 [Aspergillus taichungensis]|uniref:Uncharacterized protein n=1 Tax=Aspergillus taichungensis TaxID=482145 RepID=A0A2J5I2G3_9EURO|nr:hypothetical protein BDW42DRAFT_52668 [Aspergillus taichungensis]